MASVLEQRERYIDLNQGPLEVARFPNGRWTIKVRVDVELYWGLLLKTTRYAIVRIARYDKRLKYNTAPVYVVKPDALLVAKNFTDARRIANAQLIVKAHKELFFEEK